MKPFACPLVVQSHSEGSRRVIHIEYSASATVAEGLELAIA